MVTRELDEVLWQVERDRSRAEAAAVFAGVVLLCVVLLVAGVLA